MALREQRVQAVSQLVDSRFDWAHAFHELGRVLPRDVSLASLSGTIGSTTGAAGGAGKSSSATSAAASTSATVASATPPGSVPTFTLSGCATSQTEVALTLDRLRLIDGVSEVTLQSSTKTTGGGSGGSGGGRKLPRQRSRVRDADRLRTAAERGRRELRDRQVHRSTGAAQGRPTTSTGGAR